MTTITRQEKYGLKINQGLYNFLIHEALPGSGVDVEHFFKEFSQLIHEFGPKNKILLAVRDEMQEKIDRWYRGNDAPHDLGLYKAFLSEIGYLLPEGDTFSICTNNVDDEICKIAGPQLVVPVMNARFALNAANARWGSLYDALYGSDVISDRGGAEITPGYNPVRGEKVIAWVRDFLNDSIPLNKNNVSSNWHDVKGLSVSDNQLKIVLSDGQKTILENSAQFVGFNGSQDNPTSVLLIKNGLHVEISINAQSRIGSLDPAGISDVILESALTSIMDCEDSIAAVDGEDKIVVYRNWLGLMQGDLQEKFAKNNTLITRTLNPDRTYKAADGSDFSLPGRVLMLIRNVGHLMTNSAILDRHGHEVPEGIMDAMITSLIALHDIGPNGRRANSREGSLYIVKPKMHGPEEVAFAGEIFARVEKALAMTPNTLKMGIMDEERRTTINLKECIRAAKQRIVFINTGFLDRTGDEIHTSMEAGPMVRKGDMKQERWIAAYENWNVDIGIECGFSGHAQIGKGMWAMPDKMADMLAQKITHPEAGANTAWVPSPIAATLHATHYHKVNVAKIQADLKSRPRANIDDILSIPITKKPDWSDDDIQNELDNNAQGILGYVVRWIGQGIGCSKVPDINNVGLMEDRATLRISAQHMANWMYHGVVSEEQIIQTMKKMAKIVDLQNVDDQAYTPMANDFENSIPFQGALELVFSGRVQPNGYTEPVLHRARLEFKAQQTVHDIG